MSSAKIPTLTLDMTILTLLGLSRIISEDIFNSLFCKLSILTFFISINSTGSIGLHPKNTRNIKVIFFFQFLKDKF